MRYRVYLQAPSVNITIKTSFLIDLANNYLSENFSRPIYINDLCKALGVSYRKLYGTFMLTCGESPCLYLKRRRLMMTRQVLSNAESEDTLVKTVALDHGLWHFGNFSQDYRKLFGETPSETLALARSRRTKLPRDD